MGLSQAFTLDQVQVHFFRESLLVMEEASHIATFLTSCAQLVDCQARVNGTSKTVASKLPQVLAAAINLAIDTKPY